MRIEKIDGKFVVTGTPTEVLEFAIQSLEAVQAVQTGALRSTKSYAVSEVVPKAEVSTGFAPSVLIVAVDRE